MESSALLGRGGGGGGHMSGARDQSPVSSATPRPEHGHTATSVRYFQLTARKYLTSIRVSYLDAVLILILCW